MWKFRAPTARFPLLKCSKFSRRSTCQICLQINRNRNQNTQIFRPPKAARGPTVPVCYEFEYSKKRNTAVQSVDIVRWSCCTKFEVHCHDSYFALTTHNICDRVETTCVNVNLVLLRVRHRAPNMPGELVPEVQFFKRWMVGFRAQYEFLNFRL